MKLMQAHSGPNPKLDAPQRFYPVTDGDDHIKVVKVGSILFN
jgi:hypothetical protein